MPMSLEAICAGLQPFSPILYKTKAEPIPINRVRWLDGEEAEHATDVLYIANCSDITSDFASTNRANLMLFGEEFPFDPNPLVNSSVIWIRDRVRMKTAFNAVQDMLAASYDMGNYAVSLIHTMLEGAGLQGMIDIAARILNRSVILIDTSFKVLTHSLLQGIDEPGWKQIFELGYFPWDMVNIMKNRGILANAALSSEPFITVSWANEELERLNCKIEVDGNLVGYVILLANGREFTARDYEVLDLIVQVIAVEMRKGDFWGDARSLAHQNLILDLLDNTITQEEVALERARSIKFPTGNYFCILTLDLQREYNATGISDYLRQTTESLFAGAKTVFYKNHLTALLDLRKKNTLGDSLQNRLNNYLQNSNLRAGVSRPFNHLVELREHYDQAAMALEMALVMEAGGRLFFYEDFKTFHLLNLISTHANLLSFCHPSVLTLAEYDRKHNSNLLETLWTCLDYPQNLVLAAGHLSIHRNTLGYRLSRIRELTGLELSDNKLSFQLLLSRNIFLFMEKLAGKTELY